MFCKNSGHFADSFYKVVHGTLLASIKVADCGAGVEIVVPDMLAGFLGNRPQLLII